MFILILVIIVLFIIINKSQNIEQLIPNIEKLIPNIVITNSYSIKGYNDLVNNKDFLYNCTEGGIPKIIIKTSWQTRDNFPLQMIESLDKTIGLNPEWSIFYFDDDEVDNFMKDFSNEYSISIYNNIYSLYKKLIPGAFKADLFRICCLYKYGGCYSDIGHTCLVGLDKVCSNSNIVLVCDINKDGFHGIHNAFMCTVPKHEFFRIAIKRLCYNIDNNFYGNTPLDITGPEALGKIFNCFFNYKCDNQLENLFVYGFKIYNCDKCNVKIIKFKEKGGLPYKILDDDNQEIIDAKFKDYYNVMYPPKKTPRYGELWNSRRVYNI